MLQELAQELTPMITHLFKQSLDTSELPPDWKTSHVTSTLTKDKRIDLCDYWPISLAFILCKSFKHILVIQVMNHLEIHHNYIMSKSVGIHNKTFM